jgi:putative flippase GtrA
VAEIRERLGRHPLDSQRNRAGLAQLLRFCVVGAVSTAAYLVLYLLLRQSMDGQAANAISLLVTAVANTAANRRFTFGVVGSRGAGRHQAQGLVVFALGLGLTSGSLWALHWGAPTASPAAEAAALIAANLAATLLRFVLFRAWVFADSSPRRIDVPAESSVRKGLSA